MEDIPIDLIVSESSIEAGVAAMQRIHGRHLADMSPAEQEQAREHWRVQVEEVLASVRDAHAGPTDADAGRAVLIFADVGDEQIDVNVSLTPEPRELPGGDVELTPAQALAMHALEAISEEEEEPE